MQSVIVRSEWLACHLIRVILWKYNIIVTAEFKRIVMTFFFPASEALLTIREIPWQFKAEKPSSVFLVLHTVISGLWWLHHVKEKPLSSLSLPSFPQLVTVNHLGLGCWCSGSWVCRLGEQPLPILDLILPVAIHFQDSSVWKWKTAWSIWSACDHRHLIIDIWTNCGLEPKWSVGERQCIP